MSGSRTKVRPITPTMSPFPLEISRSPKHCLSVLACESIPRRRLVIEYTGDRINYAEAMRRFVMRGRPGRISFARLNRHWIIDAWKGNGAEYINHSCHPNLYSWRPRGHIFLCSRRWIRSGEELTFDYRIGSRSGHVSCHCGAANCRGQINRGSKSQ